jgi:hypothetical protein
MTIAAAVSAAIVLAMAIITTALLRNVPLGAATDDGQVAAAPTA